MKGMDVRQRLIENPACTDLRIMEPRRLHEEMDRAVLEAYGWKDIAVPPYCPMTDTDREAIHAFEDEVIDRLYVLNAERAREEELLGKAAEAGKTAAKKARGKKKAPWGQGEMF